jgi:hypothetical protein
VALGHLLQLLHAVKDPPKHQNNKKKTERGGALDRVLFLLDLLTSIKNGAECVYTESPNSKINCFSINM